MKRSVHLFAIGVALTGLNFGSARAQNTLNTAIMQNFGALDPAKISDFTQYMAAINLYDGLLGINTNDVLVPQVATKWAVSPDGKTYTFTIRPGIRFHSGNPLTAADVVYSMKRLLALKEGPAFLWSDVLKPENVKASGNNVTMVLNKPFSPFLNTMPLLFVLDSKTVKTRQQPGKFGQAGDYGQAFLNRNDLGSGPYRLSKFVEGAQLTLTRNKTYFKGFAAGAYDTVNIYTRANEDEVRSLIQSGQLDLTSQFQTQELYNQLEKQAAWKVSYVPGRMILYLKMNNQRAPLDDVNVRKAVAYAINYNEIHAIYPSTSPRGVLAPSFSVHNKDIPALRQDLTKARDYFAKSKYAGQNPTIDLVYTKELDFQGKIAEVVRRNLAMIGIKVNVKALPWAQIMANATKVETTPHLSEIFFVPTYPSANSVFYTQYHSQAPRGWAASTWTKNAEVDKLIDQALVSTDINVIKKKYQDLQQKLFDLMPDVPLAVQQTQFAMKTSVQGYTTNPVQSFDMNFRNFYRK